MENLKRGAIRFSPNVPNLVMKRVYHSQKVLHLKRWDVSCYRNIDLLAYSRTDPHTHKNNVQQQTFHINIL